MHDGVLSQINGREMEAERLDRSAQRDQPAVGHRVRTVLVQGAVDDIEIREQLGRSVVRRSLTDRRIARHPADQLLRSRCQPGVHTSQGLAVRFVETVRRRVGRSLGQLLDGRGDRDETRRHRQLFRQAPQLAEVVTHRQ